MITTLTGANNFGLHTELHKQIDAFLGVHDAMGLERLDGDDHSFDRVRESLQSMPFLVSKKLVVLNKPSAQKEFTEKAEALLSDVPDDINVVIVEPKLDKRSSYYKYLKKHTVFQDFPALDTHELARWVVAFAKTKGATFSQQDASYLVRRVGANQLLLSNEVEKLRHFNPKISKESIDLLTEPTVQSSIFDLLDAALHGRKQQVLDLYAEQRSAGVDPVQILALLGWQLHAMAVVLHRGNHSLEETAKAAGIHPFVLKKSAAATKNMDTSRIKYLVSEASNLDVRMKSESIDPDDALINLLLEISEK